MMEVNAFWFGFLIAVVVILVLLIGTSLIAARRGDGEREIDISEEEYKEMLENFTGKKMRVFRDSHGFLVGEAIEDRDDD